MAAPFKIECPHCETTYAPERCGIRPLQEGETASITVLCMVCKQSFDTKVFPKQVVVQPGWFQRVVMRRKPTTRIEGHAARTSLR